MAVTANGFFSLQQATGGLQQPSIQYRTQFHINPFRMH